LFRWVESKIESIGSFAQKVGCTNSI